MIETVRRPNRIFNNLFGKTGKTPRLGRISRAIRGRPPDSLEDQFHIFGSHSESEQNGRAERLGLGENAEQNVLRPDIRKSRLPRLILRDDERPFRFLRKFVEIIKHQFLRLILLFNIGQL
jgi:hypothetical protein